MAIIAFVFFPPFFLSIFFFARSEVQTAEFKPNYKCASEWVSTNVLHKKYGGNELVNIGFSRLLHITREWIQNWAPYLFLWNAEKKNNSFERQPLWVSLSLFIVHTVFLRATERNAFWFGATIINSKETSNNGRACQLPLSISVLFYLRWRVETVYHQATLSSAHCRPYFTMQVPNDKCVSIFFSSRWIKLCFWSKHRKVFLLNFPSFGTTSSYELVWLKADLFWATKLFRTNKDRHQNQQFQKF